MFVCCDKKRTCLNFFISVFPLPDWRRWRGGGHRERNAADQCGKSSQKIWTLLSHLPSNRHPPTFYEKLKLTTTKIKFVQKKNFKQKMWKYLGHHVRETKCCSAMQHLRRRNILSSIYKTARKFIKILLTLKLGLHIYCRRRINTEEKAKVVAAVSGTEFIELLAALAVLHLEDLKNRMNCTRMI